MAKQSPTPVSLTWYNVRQLTVSLEGTEQSTSYGTPAMKVNGKLYVRQHQEGENIVLRMEKQKRGALIRSNPAVFHVTEHYVAYPYVLARLALIGENDLAAALEEAWRIVTAKQ